MGSYMDREEGDQVVNYVAQISRSVVIGGIQDKETNEKGKKCKAIPVVGSGGP
jgi:hypothetical protein